ncbi:MAG: PAS domain-containing sensor histidine kinase, partial [Planctomycetota bacterium]|nr:PAS domain-containing sensor histidine kinase [Planctomycetota bacterium]
VLLRSERSAERDRDRLSDVARSRAGDVAASEARAQAIVNSVFDAVVTLDSKGAIIGWNAAASQMFGLSTTEALGQPITDVLSIQISGDLAEGVQLLQGVRSDGKNFPAEVSVAHVFSSTPSTSEGALLVAVIRDQTAAQDQEQRLQQMMVAVTEEKARLESILSATTDGVLFVGPSGKVQYANPRFSELMGIPLDRVVMEAGAELHQMVSVLKPEPADAFEGVFGVESEDWIERVCSLSGATPLNLQIRSVPLLSDGSEPVGRLVMIRDISAEWEAERTREQVVANVSHELRNPLSTIRGFVDLLLHQEPSTLNERQSRFLEIISKNVDGLSLMVSDLLALDHTSVGPPDSEGVALKDLLEGLREEHHLTTFKKSLAFDIECTESARVVGQRSRIRQILANLLSNAIKYTEEGRVSVDVCESQGVVTVDVRDTGIGLSSADQKHVFERFFRSNEAYVRESAGSGLGLAIAKQYVEELGGSIRLTSVLGEGSVFSVTLPSFGGDGTALP